MRDVAAAEHRLSLILSRYPTNNFGRIVKPVSSPLFSADQFSTDQECKRPQLQQPDFVFLFLRFIDKCSMTLAGITKQ
jgi:hypothetical protein